jgi:2-dehydropantoate 2-reductase
MLQEAEHGRPLEIDALLTVTCDLGRMVGVRTPFINGILGLARLKATSLGLLDRAVQPGRVASQSRSSSLRLISSCD